MKRIIPLTSIAILGLTLGLSAEWLLVEDFQDPNFKDNWYFATNGVELDPYTNSVVPLEDPSEPGNMGLYIESGFYGVDNSNIWFVRELPNGGMQPNTTATMFFRYIESGFSNNIHIGTSDLPLELNTEYTNQATQPGTWSHYNYLWRKAEFTGSVEHRDGSAYVNTNPPYTFTANEWYNIWMVMTHTYATVDGQLTYTGSWELYIQGPDDAEPVLIPVGTDPQKDAALPRRAPFDELTGGETTIKWFMGGTNTGRGESPNAGDPWITDDIYITYAGKNLSNPITGEGGMEWAGYPMDEAGNVDTGTWLGWINVSGGDYVWSYTLNQWMYLPEAGVTEAGSWTYIFN